MRAIFNRASVSAGAEKMPWIVLKDITPESAEAELIRVGVKPGECVTVIVAGDDDLLTLDSFEGRAILSPAEFVARFGSRHEPEAT